MAYSVGKESYPQQATTIEANLKDLHSLDPKQSQRRSTPLQLVEKCDDVMGKQRRFGAVTVGIDC